MDYVRNLEASEFTLCTSEDAVVMDIQLWVSGDALQLLACWSRDTPAPSRAKHQLSGSALARDQLGRLDQYCGCDGVGRWCGVPGFRQSPPTPERAPCFGANATSCFSQVFVLAQHFPSQDLPPVQLGNLA